MLHQTRQWFERPHTGSLRPSHVLLHARFSTLYSFLTVWLLLLLLPCILAWRLHPPGKELVLSCPSAPENSEGNLSWFKDGPPTRHVYSNSGSKSLVIENPGYTESGNYTCCHTSNRSGHANCSSSFIVFADKKELPPNLLRDTLPQPGGTPIFKGITYWMPSMLLSFRPRLFLGQTNFSCLYYIRTKIRVPRVEWFYVDSNSDVAAIPPVDALHQVCISWSSYIQNCKFYYSAF
ncbi:unnamed protein product [Dibothriocephalus latus]|uniref:Ig-like domain-containing protein n=1 Tax=Dibothriocephalus latus TaxID=60516 RepID=A0A3P7PA51_DIBLA|nr:unnamed protein product [Dibothriocephalus latus]